MIKIKDPKDCCGCEACSNICPTSCIVMQPNEEGFFYPSVQENLCINCGLCETTCPNLSTNEIRQPLVVFGAINNDLKERQQSSSGGVFPFIAEKIIKNGGCVIGATYDTQWNVHHTIARTKKELDEMRGSKYVQSRLGNIYKETRTLLKEGKTVLFSGTSCQILALNLFLKKEYTNLITIELICAGVPSPFLWNKYLDEEVYSKIRIEKVQSPISNIEFRNKTISGWKNFHIVISTDEPAKSVIADHHSSNPYFSCFLKRAVQRYSCYSCPAKAGKCKSDITLGDFWGFIEDINISDDNNGVSVVMANTTKGLNLLDGLILTERTYEEVKKKNPASIQSAFCSVYRKNFYKTICHQTLRSKMKKLNRLIFLRKGINKILRISHIPFQFKY